jgi:AbrB family looped-hinge helix DNA binding protein
MKKIEITRLSSRGQVVIPKNLREGLEEGTPFVVSKNGDVIVLKKIPIDKAWEEFNKIFEKNRKIVKKTGLKPSDVPKIIQRIRRERYKSSSNL